MSNPDSPSAFLDNRVIVSGHRAMQAAYLWILASLVTAVGIAGMVYLVSERSEREAGRMIIASQNGTGYVAVIVGGMAQHHGRPAP